MNKSVTNFMDNSITILVRLDVSNSYVSIQQIMFGLVGTLGYY
jgi:hypothetical protein